MVENKEIRSQSPKGQLRHSYTLADGQRIPVLFRMKNIQSAATADTRSGASKAQVKAPAVESISNEAVVHPPKFATIGPSWLRRNAYPITVSGLLVVTLLVLNNNRHSNVSAKPSNIEHKLDAPVVDLAGTQPVPTSSVEAATPVLEPLITPATTQVAAVKEELQEVKNESVAAPALVQNDTPKSNLGTVEVTESASSTLYLINKPTSDPSKSDLATAGQASNENSSLTGQSPPSVSPPAEATLLAPQILGNTSTTEPQLVATQPTTIRKPELPAGIPATTVSAENKEATSFQGVASAPQPNRYLGAPASAGVPQSTNEPNLDPSVLFAIKQNYQVQSSEQTVRDMRQQAQTQSPGASSAANQWQAIPVGNTLPANAFTPSNNAVPNNVPTPAARQTANGSNLPQQGSVQTTPTRSTYVPLSPSLTQQPNDPSLFPVATTPDGSSINTPQKPAAYQPLYNQQPSTQPGMDYSWPYKTNNTGNQLYENADQSFGMGN